MHSNTHAENNDLFIVYLVLHMKTLLGAFNSLLLFLEVLRKLKLMKLMAFTSILLLLSVIAAGKPPTLEYGIIRNHNNAPPSKMHPPPVNDPKRGCNPENFCRHFTLSVENPSGTRVEAVAIVEAGAPLNSTAGMEAIAAGIAHWLLNKTNGNASGQLSVSMDPIANATDSAQMLQRQAVSRGIANMGLGVQYRSATEDAASLPPVDGKITITVDAASNQVVLKFFTQVQSLGETDIIHILEYAKAKLRTIQKKKGKKTIDISTK